MQWSMGCLNVSDSIHSLIIACPPICLSVCLSVVGLSVYLFVFVLLCQVSVCICF